MTLCLVWRTGGEITFASDSRLTNTDESIITDDATKIFKIDLKIWGPGEEEILHESSLGFCFTGSYLNGSLLADTIEEVLTNLQGVPKYSDFSLDNISKIAFALYKQITKQLMEIHRAGGLSEVLLGGYCPLSAKFQLYKFYPKSQEGEMIDFAKEEILLEQDVVYIGDPKAKEIITELIGDVNSHYTHFHMLRDIINDNYRCPTVGGNIQVGKFDSQRFKTYGIAEYYLETDEFGFDTVGHSYKYRGFSLNFEDTEMRSGELNIMKNFLNPFENERNDLFIQSNKSNEDKVNKSFK